ncbi:MAG: TetR/AcrR family transcriptional regulator [Anaerolineae bacterium]|nr:TetR/AcrR family transcriptional regulator [Anaerolineae bacterium]
MVTRKPDRRKPRTRRLLRDALLDLILEKGYDQVTVQDIADRANLGRATFYLHFVDKEDLLMSSLREMFDDLKARFDLPTAQEMPLDLPLRAVPFQHADEYRDIYRVILLSQQGTAAVLNGIRDYLAESIQERIEAARGTAGTPRVPVEVVAHYLAGALLSMIGWWLRQEMAYSAEAMADLFRELALPSLVSVFGDDLTQQPGA